MSRSLRVLLCLLLVLAVPLSLAVPVFGLPAQYGETYLAALPLKWDRLRQTESPRILLVGGSGVAFDTRCDLLEQELPGYRAVNFGLYAGLGTAVMLDLALREVRAGDIVVFSPELSAQTLSDFFDPQAMWQAAEGRPDLLAALPARYAAPMLGALPAFAGAKARLCREGAAPAGDGIYARRSFNAWGDIAASGREANVMPGGWDENMPLLFDPALITPELTEWLAAAERRCEKAGATLVFRFCPMNAAALSDTERARMDAFTELLRERLPCPLLGDPAEALMDPGWFFDTNFHLNEAGAAAATARLAGDLKALLGDPGPVNIPLPAMPAPADAAAIDGDNGDDACFLYIPAEGGLRITGLTAEGAARERLTVPASHEGQPVAGFDAGVFAGNGQLRELILQENIRAIPDGAFDGCLRLERLVLRHTAPESCAVGTDLLRGTQALVYVPADRVSAYCTNYFWSLYADRIRADGAESAPASPAPEETPEPRTASPRPGPNDVLYLGNGGRLRRQEGDSLVRTMDSGRARFNTLQGTAYFEREGYVLLGWSDRPQGGGLIGLGSRVLRQSGLTLYAQWAEASPVEDFVCAPAEDGVSILAYEGPEGRCVVPESIDGLPVRRIGAGAFDGMDLDALVLPSSLRTVEPGAFAGCRIGELTLFDSLREVGDDCFVRGSTVERLRVNAAVSPVYSGSYFAAFAEKYDRLLSLQGERKLVLASGSSGRYGYDSEALQQAFPAYAVVNMGVYAYSNAMPQLELFRALMAPGDILLSAPEFDAVTEQFCVTNRLDAPFWAMMEANYDAAAALDLTRYEAVFDSFAEYQRIRSGMEPTSYTVNPAGFDDDGSAYPFPTYNAYGDFILPRPNNDRDERQHLNTADYTAASFPPAVIEALNGEYRRFLEEGITVYFSFSPRNRSSLTPASTPAARAELQALLERELCVPVISQVEDYLLSGVYFWKIDSHPSTEGAALRTRQIIQDLTLQLQAEADGGQPGG